MLKYIRVGVAVSLGIALTAWSAFWMTVFGDIDGPGKWCDRIERYFIQGIIGVKHVVTGDIRPIEDDELVIVYANHQASLGLSGFGFYINIILGQYATFIAKEDLVWWIRIPLNRVGVLLLVDRNNSEVARQQLADAIPDLIARKQMIVVLTDSSRWKPEHVVTQKKKYSKVLGIEEMLKDLLVPRAGGISQILDAVGNRPVRILEIANGFKDQQASDRDLMGLVGSEFHVMVEEIDRSSIPGGKDERRDWLNNRFLLMARKLRSVREGRGPISA